MTARIGRIPYLNSEVFYYGMAGEADVELLPLAPRALSDAAVDGGLDAGPVPLVTCFELEHTFRPLGDFCIATVEKARSILLYSKRPVDEMTGAVVGVTGETSTSVRLMKTLLSRRFRVTPNRYVGLDDEPTDAFLLIGDEALRQRRGVPGYPHLYDLGEEWHRWTGLPFVFARWVVRRDLNDDKVRWLEALLSRSIELGLAAVEEIAAARRDLDMTCEEIVQYVRSFHYQLGDEEMKAIDKFRRLLSTPTPAPSPTLTTDASWVQSVHEQIIKSGP